MENEYQPKCGDALRLGSKGMYDLYHLWINVWLAGKAAWSLVNTCHTWALSHDKVLYKSTVANMKMMPTGPDIVHWWDWWTSEMGWCWRGYKTLTSGMKRCAGLKQMLKENYKKKCKQRSPVAAELEDGHIYIALLQHGTPFLSPSKTVHLSIVSSAT